MASYRLLWKRSAEKELRKSPHEAIVRLVSLAGSLAENPFPPGVRKLAGTEHTYRARATKRLTDSSALLATVIQL